MSIRELLKKNKDKVLHLIVCIVVSIIDIPLAIGLAVGKEYGDYAHIKSWSYGDFIADGLGIIVGGTIHLFVT